MSKTPVPADLTRKLYTPKGTIKHLLTPCRPVGLSRRKKTPGSNNTKIYENKTEGASSTIENTPETAGSNNTKASENRSVGVKITPLSSIHSEAPSSNSTTISENNTLKVSSVQTTPLSSINSNRKDDDFEPKAVSASTLKTNNRKSRVSKRLITDDCEQFDSKKDPLTNDVPSKKVPKIKDTKEITENNKIPTESNNKKRKLNMDDQVITEIEKPPEKKNTIDLQKTTSPLIAIIENTKTSTSKLVAQNLKKVPKNTIKRSLSMKKSSEDYENKSTEDNCFLENTFSENVTENDIKELQKQIKEKQKLIDELKQAEIYRRKHDLNELSNLIATWKNGCIAALNDLLPEVQSHHISIDMPTLLTNLNIPKEIITLNSDGDLI